MAERNMNNVNISNKGRGITVQTHKSLEAQEVSFSTVFEESLW